AAHDPHAGALHSGRERHLARPGGVVHAELLALRARRGDPRIHRRRADELARLRIRRWLGPDRALPPPRSDGPPRGLNGREGLWRLVEVGGGWWRLVKVDPVLGPLGALQST